MGRSRMEEPEGGAVSRGGTIWSAGEEGGAVS